MSPPALDAKRPEGGLARRKAVVRTSLSAVVSEVGQSDGCASLQGQLASSAHECERLHLEAESAARNVEMLRMRLQIDVDETRQTREELKAALQEQAVLQDRLATSEHERKCALMQLDRAKQEMLHMQHQLGSSKEEKMALLGQLRVMKQGRQLLVCQCGSLAKEVESLRMRLHTAQGEEARLMSQYRSLEKQAGQLRAQFNAQQAAQGALREKFELIKHEREQQREALHSARIHGHALQAQTGQAEQERKQLHSMFGTELCAQKNARGQLFRLGTEARALQGQVGMLRNYNHALKTSVKRAEGAHDKLTAHLDVLEHSKELFQDRMTQASEGLAEKRTDFYNTHRTGMEDIMLRMARFRVSGLPHSEPYPDAIPGGAVSSATTGPVPHTLPPPGTLHATTGGVVSSATIPPVPHTLAPPGTVLDVDTPERNSLMTKDEMKRLLFGTVQEPIKMDPQDGGEVWHDWQDFEDEDWSLGHCSEKEHGNTHHHHIGEHCKKVEHKQEEIEHCKAKQEDTEKELAKNKLEDVADTGNDNKEGWSEGQEEIKDWKEEQEDKEKETAKNKLEDGVDNAEDGKEGWSELHEKEEREEEVEQDKRHNSEIEGKANGSEHKETDADNRGCNARHATLLMLEEHEDKDTGTPEEQAEQVKATGTGTVGKDEQLEVDNPAGAEGKKQDTQHENHEAVGESEDETF